MIMFRLIKYIYQWLRNNWYLFLGILLVINLFCISVIKSDIIIPYALGDVYGLLFVISVLLGVLTILYKFYKFYMQLSLNSRIIFTIITLLIILSCMIVFPPPGCTNCN